MANCLACRLNIVKEHNYKTRHNHVYTCIYLNSVLYVSQVRATLVLKHPVRVIACCNVRNLLPLLSVFTCRRDKSFDLFTNPSGG